MSQYEVGNILWIVHSEKPGLMAYQVVEEITKKTLQGEVISYIISPARPNAKPLALETIKGRVFESKEQAKEAMLSNANKAIDNMLEVVQDSVNKFLISTKSTESQFVEAKLPQSIPLTAPDAPLPDGYQWVEMDGKKVKVKLPDSIM